MKYYVIAGEVSGDMHSSLLLKYIKEKDKEAEFRCWGGDNMQKEGGFLVRHIKDLAFMGFVEVLTHLKTVLGNLSFCKKDILDYKPDAIILTDYPGFNLKIAKFAHKHGFKVFYYISPQVWIWKKGRIKTMKKVLEKLYVILPFEKPFYAQHNMEVDYYGNPLLDEISIFKNKGENKEVFLQKHNLGSKPIIAILPGSRTQEIKAMLPVQLSIYDKYKDKFDFVIAGVNMHSEEFYKKYIGNRQVKLIFNDTYNILNVANAGLITSGTATLETALFDVPQVVCYKASKISYAIANIFLSVKYISLVNIILDRLAVVELLQKMWNKKNLEEEFERICFDYEYITKMKKNYAELRQILGNAGASEQIATSIVEHLKK